MEKKKCILLYALAFAVLFGIASVAVNIFSLHFRLWVTIAAMVIIALGLIVGFIQIIIKADKKSAKVAAAVFLILTVTAGIGIGVRNDLFFPEEHIIYSQADTKYVCRQRLLVFGIKGDIYDYKNSFVFKDGAVDSYYCDGWDPFDNVDEYSIIEGDKDGKTYKLYSSVES